MKIHIIQEEWLPYPASYRCIFTIDDSDVVKIFAKRLDSLEELEARDSSLMIKEIKESYDRQT